MRVLLVEDDVLIRMNTAELLAIHGVGVIEAGSAEDAITVLQTTAIDILLTDVNLPGLSGPELAVRARSLKPSIGIVFATGDSQAVANLADASTILLPKPYSSKDLATAVRAVLGKIESTDAEQDQLSSDDD